ncbi:MAG: AAA family ATPase [Oscillospiraceae bacterium]|nr:AAA family ATPase [Oscillospiraceae bacterium]
MGIYLNPGKQSFTMAVNSEIFVDKTPMIRYLNTVINTQQRFVSVSRPRRFGKTMAANMVAAYYDCQANSRELFEGLKLSVCRPAMVGKKMISWDTYLGKFDVLRLIMTDFTNNASNAQDMIGYLTNEVTDELMMEYPDVHYGERINLWNVMNRIYTHTKRQFVIIIDEWDVIFRYWRDDKDSQREYLNFLRSWLKDKDYVALAYMTGILPIKKYGEHSALNMFDEYSMIQPMQLAPYTGFTEEEVEELCQEYGRDFAKIKDWYDGYEVYDIIPRDRDYQQLRSTGEEPVPGHHSLYSPLSVVKAVSTGQIKNYWNNTETYEALAEHIRMDFDGLKETIALLMDGGRVKVGISKYQNDMTSFQSSDDVLTMLIHLGYLGYDSERGEAFIPNKEILEVFKDSTDSREWADTMLAFRKSQELLQATWTRDEEKVAELLEAAHDRAGNRTYNDEAALSYAVQYAYYAAQKYYTTIQELDSGKGYADLAYLPSPRYPDKPVLIIELKYGRSADEAIDQIRKKDYPARFEHYKGNILLMGISYDKDITSKQEGYKKHSCRIESVETL